MTITRKLLAAGLLALASAASMTVHAASDDLAQLYKTAKTEGKVVMYTSIPSFILDAWKEQFNKAYPGVELEFFRSGTGKVVARVEAESRAGQIQGDLLWVADAAIFPELVKKDLLAAYRSPEWDKVKFGKERDGHFIMGRVLVGAIFANTNTNKATPTSWNDLTKPEYKDQVAIPSPLVSGSMAVIVGTMVHDKRYGWDYFRKLKNNGALVLQDVPDTARAAASGERALGVSLTMYKFQPELAASPVKIVYPDDGSVLMPSPFGIFKSAPHPAAARLLERFLLSTEAQQVLADHGIYAARSDVPPPKGMPPLADLQAKGLMPDISWLSLNQNQLKSEWRNLFGH